MMDLILVFYGVGFLCSTLMLVTSIRWNEFNTYDIFWIGLLASFWPVVMYFKIKSFRAKKTDAKEYQKLYGVMNE